MPVLSRKRRAPEPQEASESGEEPQTQRRQRQRSPDSEPSERGDEQQGDEEGDGSAIDQLARKLVRYAISCEYARRPIRRDDISKQVLGTQSRQFNAVFEEAQLMLRDTFGMEMELLPARDKVTLQEKRAAQKRESQTVSKIYILTSTLPDKYRTEVIVPPSRVPTSTQEAAYVGLYTFIIGIIYLHGGRVQDSKLERHLRRMNAEQTTPVDKTDKLLARMVKEGYIVKIKDMGSGDDVIEYMVGPRGKVEVGAEGVGSLVRAVYGDSVDDLDKRLERSLGIANAATSTQTAAGKGGRTGKKRRSTRRNEGDEEPEDEGELTLDESGSE